MAAALLSENPDVRRLHECLFAPRNVVEFGEVEGAYVDPSDAGLKPVTIIRNLPSQELDEVSPGSILGVESGSRSGLLLVDGKPCKVKGCGIPPEVLTRDGFYDRSYGYYEPHNGQTITSVRNEIDMTGHINAILGGEGFPVLCDPFAIIHYGKKYRPKTIWHHILTAIGIFKPEELAASVMRIQGDTRLPEIYSYRAKNKRAASDLAYKSSLMAGAETRLLENAGILWGIGNRHVGNYVVFQKGDEIYMRRGDSDTARKLSSLRKNVFEKLAEEERRRLLSSLMRNPSEWLIVGRPTDLHKLRPPPEYFSSQFLRGFNEGYANPDRRLPIRREDLRAAYGI